MLEQQHVNLVNAVDQFISENISQSISIASIANEVGVSKFHLHRIFAAQTGFEISEYIQRRRMERALALLQSRLYSVIEVALEVGYDSHSSFSRVFKQAYDVTPNQIVNGDSCEALIRYKKKSKSQLSDVELTWLYVEKQEIQGRYCKGFSHGSFAKSASETFAFLTELSQHKDYIKSQPIGVALTNPWQDDTDKAGFFCGLLTGLEQVEPCQLETFVWPPGQYIKVLYQGPYQQMWQFISQLHRSWIEATDIRLATRQVIQRYLNHPLTTPESELKTELYFALQ